VKVITATIQWEGKVQDVGFRAFVRKSAERNQVTGSVANQSDGSVIASMQGTKEAVAAVIKDSIIGPPGSEILKISFMIINGNDKYTSFKVDD
jgi:acylphosphatase